VTFIKTIKSQTWRVLWTLHDIDTINVCNVYQKNYKRAFVICFLGCFFLSCTAINFNFTLCTATYCCLTTGDAFAFICVYVHVYSYLFWFCLVYCYVLLWRCMCVWYAQLNSTYLLTCLNWNCFHISTFRRAEDLPSWRFRATVTSWSLWCGRLVRDGGTSGRDCASDEVPLRTIAHAGFSDGC